MTTVIAIDPGLRNLGIAVFVDGALYRAALIRNPVKKARDGEAWVGMATATKAWLYGVVGDTVEWPSVMVAEIPQVYARRLGGDPDDLLQLAGVVGAVASVVGPAEFFAYRPREWKGTVDGSVFAARIEASLTPAERAVIDPHPRSLAHNIWDSVQLAKVHMERRRR